MMNMVDTTTETVETSAPLPPTEVLANEPAPPPRTREEQPKPPTLNALLVERMERTENVIVALAEDVRFYGQETMTHLAALHQQGDDQDFWQRLIVVALFVLVFFFGVFIGVGVLLALRGV